MTILVFFIIAGFVGTPSGITTPSLNKTNYVVTNLACNDSFECTNTTGYSGCSSYGGGYAAVTCGRCMSPTTCVCLFISLIPSIFSFVHKPIYLFIKLPHKHMYTFHIVCSDEVRRLYNNYTTIVDGNIVDIGIPQQCTLGAWSSICNDGTNTNNVADLVCRVFGYTGKS